MRPRPPGPWVAARQQPLPPNPLDDFRLFAIIGAWMEEDVIAATVANAFAQGCERVYLVDNASTDGTVREAEAAGAVLAEVFATERYDEVLRLEIMNRVVREMSEESGSEHVWWLWRVCQRVEQNFASVHSLLTHNRLVQQHQAGPAH